MNKYYFKRKHYGPSSLWTGVDRDKLRKSHYTFDVTKDWNIKIVKDRDNLYQDKVWPMQYDHEHRLTGRHRRFLCEVLLERENNTMLQDYISDNTIDALCLILIRSCYDNNIRVSLNGIRELVLSMNYRDFIGV